MDTTIDTTIDDLLDPYKRYQIGREGYPLGTILRGNDQEYVQLFMDWWTSQFDVFEDHLRTPEFYFTRLFTYDEFTQWHRGTAQPLLDEVEKRVFGFKADHDISHRGYCQAILAIAEISNPKISQFFYKPLSVRIPDESRRMHTYIVGGSGSGKTTLLSELVYNDIMSNDRCVIVQDPKGDLARNIAKIKEFAPSGIYEDRLIYINLAQFTDRFPIFNPFDQFTDVRLAVNEMRGVLNNVFKELNDSSEFTGAMQSMMATLLAICYHNDLSFVDLYKMVAPAKKDGKKYIDPDLSKYEAMAESLTNEEHRRYFKEDFKDAFVGTKDGIRWRVREFLMDELFQHCTNGTSTFNLREITDSNKVLVLSLAKGELGTGISSIFGKVILSTILTAIQMRSANPKGTGHLVSYYIDEVQNSITESFGTMKAEARSYGLQITCAQQLVGQKMSPEMERLVLGNTYNKILGLSSIENSAIMSKQMSIEVDDIMSLPLYSYYIRVGHGKAFMVNQLNRNLLNGNNMMTDDEWVETLAIQKTKYYREPKPLYDVVDEFDLPFPLD